MENKLGNLESLPDLFSDTGNEIDFVHSTSSESSDDSFIQSLRERKYMYASVSYLGTLSIQQNQVYTAHSTKNVETNTPIQDQRGKNGNSRRVSKGDPVLVREHIKSFPVVQPHYCRAHTKREYLGSHLSIVPPSVLH
ncbi:hypothetical protein AVEN_49439-1 [Araneus ventricosus]|uniref:Uncharacterized protein n=1 Tax=Araneus ventricosus TaxID=182803 RepID=A0A4Y2CPI4_ARAVE|nr:hypothetical protein AVEN_49439-1 [Araneus ventricosus]